LEAFELGARSELTGKEQESLFVKQIPEIPKEPQTNTVSMLVYLIGVRTQKSLARKGEYARDEDGDGFSKVHIINTIEGFWSLLRSWLKSHRGISQEKLPLYLGFFDLFHSARKRGKTLLSALLECLLK